MCAAVFHLQSKLFKTIPATGLLIPIKCPDDKIIEMTGVLFKGKALQENTLNTWKHRTEASTGDWWGSVIGDCIKTDDF